MQDLIVERIVEGTKRAILNNKEEFKNQETGVNFFQILGISQKENYHSKFLAYLLDPSASHNCGADFLNLFLKGLAELNPDFPTTEEFGSTKARVGIEHFCGEKGDIDGVVIGGRIDIVIFPGNQNQGKVMPIVIENKIYAGDQPDQLIRAKNEFKNGSWLYYLTIFGNLASSYTAGNLAHNNAFNGYQSISYKHFIHSWLENCADVQKSKHAITHSIKSYTLTIEQVAKMTPKLDQEMFENLNNSFKYLALTTEIDVLDTIELLKTGVNNFLPLLNRKFADNLKTAIGEGFSVEPNDSFGHRYAYIKVKPESWGSYYIGIGFDSENKNFTDGCISICGIAPFSKETQDSISFQINNSLGKQYVTTSDFINEHPFYFWYIYFEQLNIGPNNWDGKEVLKMNTLEFAVPFANVIKSITEELVSFKDLHEQN